VASKNEFFKDENLDTEIIRMNANVSITALSTGDIDYTMVFASVVRGALRGMPMRVVASYMDSSTHLLIARPEYKSLKRAEGKNSRRQYLWSHFRRRGAHDVQASRR
jgi:ABC-type nitrate/sulfonate/bicarbonate transport system substrate-binding protein